MQPSGTDEQRYQRLVISGTLQKAVNAYAIGMRGTELMTTLGTAKALADNIGEAVPKPKGFDRLSWENIVSAATLRYLGDTRCLGCWEYFMDNKYRCYVGLHRSVEVKMCPHCGGTVTEPIKCVKTLAG